MMRPLTPLHLFSALALAACASAPSTGPQPAPAADATEAAASQAEAAGEAATEPAETMAAGNASFTDEQADRGRATFRGMCTECHYSSEFSDSQFKFKWSRRSAGSLYQLISSQMPETAPGSLSPEEAVDLVSYVLRMNGFEPGTAELVADREVLDQISLASIR